MICIMVCRQGLVRALIAGNLLWWGFLDNLIWGVLLLFGALFLVQWGAVGLAAANAIAYLLNTIVFVPWYLRLGLVPRNTIISLEAVGIWLSVIFLAFVNWINTPIVFRVICFPITTLLVFLFFRRLVKLNKG